MHVGIILVGENEGNAVGIQLGLVEGMAVGNMVGLLVGFLVGFFVGAKLGRTDGTSVGKALGFVLGLCVGAALGTTKQVLISALKDAPFLSLMVPPDVQIAGAGADPWNTNEEWGSDEGTQYELDTRYSSFGKSIVNEVLLGDPTPH